MKRKTQEQLIAELRQIETRASRLNLDNYEAKCENYYSHLNATRRKWQAVRDAIDNEVFEQFLRDEFRAEHGRDFVPNSWIYKLSTYDFSDVIA